jgi:acetolactate synthase-1/2/3 large subunit
VSARRVDSPEALGTALSEAIKADEPALIEIPVGEMPNPWKAMGLR